MVDPFNQTPALFFASLKQQHSVSELNLESIKKEGVAVARGSAEQGELQQMGFVEGKNLILTVDYMDTWHMLLKKRAAFTYVTSTLDNS